MRLLAICLALLAGCLSVTSTPIGTPPHELYVRQAYQVEVFASGPPSRPHVDVALLRASGGVEPSVDGYLAEVRARAAAEGCDAIVITGVNGNQHPSALLATCIVYTDGVATGP